MLSMNVNAEGSHLANHTDRYIFTINSVYTPASHNTAGNDNLSFVRVYT